MREVIHHWWILAVRALLALGLAGAVLLLQAWAKYALLDAVTVPFLVIALSAYGLLDSAVVFYLGWQFSPHAPARMISLTQGVCGMVFGTLLLTVLFRDAQLEWFLYLVTGQAAATGLFEILAGLRFTSHMGEEWSCFAVGAASLGFAVQTAYGGTVRVALDVFFGYAVLLGLSMAWFGWRLWRLHRGMRHAHTVAA